MSSDAGSPSSAPPADPGGGEEGRIKSLDDRFSAIETQQREQRGILDRIEQALAGGQAPKTGDGQGAGTGGSPAPELSVAEQVRRGVKEIEAEKTRKAAAAKTDADAAAWRQSVEERLAEKKPAQPVTGRKARFQRFLVGKPDQ